MSNVTFFGGNLNEDSQEDLPWIKDWSKGVTTPGDPKEIIDVWLTDKGLLLVTTEYKAFLFSKQSIHQQLLEALETWVIQGLETKPIVCAYIGKKICVGIDNDGKLVRWFQDENKFYSKRVDDSPSPKRKANNPFLTPNNPTQSSVEEPNKKPPKKQTQTVKEKPLEAATSP